MIIRISGEILNDPAAGTAFVGVAPALVGTGVVMVVCGFVTPVIPVVEVAVKGTLPGRIMFACFITSVSRDHSVPAVISNIDQDLWLGCSHDRYIPGKNNLH